MRCTVNDAHPSASDLIAEDVVAQSSPGPDVDAHQHTVLLEAPTGNLGLEPLT